MSLDETCITIWNTTKPPLAILAAGYATDMVVSRQPAQVRAPFNALSKATIEMWSKWENERNPKEIYENEFAACLEMSEAEPAVELAMQGAYVQMAAVLLVIPFSLPANDIYGFKEEEFQTLVRAAAKVGKLPVAQFEARLKSILQNKNESWPLLNARMDRMRWEPGPPWGKLGKRLKELASLADLGATASWLEMGDQRVFRLELDATKLIAALSDEELASLSPFIPAID